MFDELRIVLRAREVLGVVALVLAGWALVNIDAVNQQTAEQECRDNLDAEVIVEFSQALQRIEAGLAAVAVGDEEALAGAVSVTDAEARDFDRAITRRDNAVILCEGA